MNFLGKRKWIIGGILIVIVFSYGQFRPTAEFKAGTPGTEISFEVANGQSGSAIAINLQKRGVIKSSKIFFQLAVKDPRSQSIAPGVHLIHTHLTSNQALLELLDTKRLIGVINIKEGTTLSDVVAQVKSSSSISGYSDAVLKKVKPAIANVGGSLEGMFFPAQYSFAKGTRAKSAFDAMVAKFSTISAEVHLERGFENYSSYQVLTVASMAQVEGDPSDFAKISQVIYNRLRIGMPLQLNSTVQYAANLRGQISLSASSLQIQSPYNTYRNVGLPPTPISNPGQAAILSALHPEKGSWLYFITVKPGDTRFTADYSQFAKWEIVYHQNLAAGAFK
ncbi:MAG: endolytic transglycosylase MltG [Actinomycetes bacterium]